jgi:solute carrier family 25 (adenine nucleotide translocator) protein 4/5/6/31
MPTTSFGLDFVAGGLSGCVSKTLAAPIDRVKLLLQTQKVNADLAGNKRYNGTLDCIRRVYREQGPLSFWRGNVANLLRYFPNQALSFSFKDKFRSLLQLEGQKNRTYMVLGNLLASGAAGGAAMAMLYPLDMARTRLATDVGSSLPARRYNGTLHCLQSIYRENGIRGLYTGMSVSITGVIIFRALFMGGYVF